MRQSLLILLLMAALGAAARMHTDSVRVQFRQSHVQLQPERWGNGAALDSLRAVLGRGEHAARVRVVGAASPEGPVGFNRWLSRRRAAAVQGYLGATDSIAEYRYLDRDWHGLRAAVEADSAVPYREDVLELLGDICADYAGSQEPEHSGYLRRLKALHGGVPYYYMYSRLFPALRATRVYVDSWWVQPLDVANAYSWPVAEATPGQPLQPSVARQEARRPVYWALKTNLLYDAALLPTVGAEVYLGRGWSAMAEWTYGWWDVDRTHWYWRAYGGNLGIRRWLGARAKAKPLTGHHVGLFGGVITYDFEFGHQGIMGGLPGRTLWDRCNAVAGVEYGYSAPIGRRLNLDFVIGVGYLGGKYIKYEPYANGYAWLSTHRLNYFGPVKAEISLVWLLGRDNYNR